MEDKEENILSINLGKLLYKLNEEKKDLIILKKLSESNILLKDPERTVNLIYNQLIIERDILLNNYDRLIGSLEESVLQTGKENITEKDNIDNMQTEEITTEENNEDIKKDNEDINNKITDVDSQEYVDTEYIEKEDKEKEIKTNSKLSEELKKKIEQL